MLRLSVLFNEPKLLKFLALAEFLGSDFTFSALQRAEIAEIRYCSIDVLRLGRLSVLFNEPKLLK